jgi:hypothetical protein
MSKKLYQIKRNDGRLMRNTYDSKTEAEKDAKGLFDPKHPFTYKVVEISTQKASA